MTRDEWRLCAERFASRGIDMKAASAGAAFFSTTQQEQIMPNPLTRLTAARFDGPQALYTEAVRLLSERPALPGDLAGLVARLREEKVFLAQDAADAIEALVSENARLSASEPQCAVVKPLAWSTNGKDCFRANGLDCIYDILELSEGRFVLTFRQKLFELGDLASAQMAAQADHDARILPAITLRPEVEVRAEAWAAAIEAAVEAAWNAARDDESACDVADAIRALTPPADIAAALDRIKADAKAEGMRRAAVIARSVFDGMPSIRRENHEYFDGYDDATRAAEAAILAAIPEGAK